MTSTEQCERFRSRYSKLSDLGKQYIEAILQSLEFAQDMAARIPSRNTKSKRAATQAASRSPNIANTGGKLKTPVQVFAPGQPGDFNVWRSTMRLGNVEVDKKKLMAKAELRGFLEENGETDRTLNQVRDQQREKFGMELIWRYPVPDDNHHTGMYIAAVKEGFLCLPYSDVGLEGWECIDLINATMLTAQSLEKLINSWRLYSEGLLNDMTDILFGLNNG